MDTIIKNPAAIRTFNAVIKLGYDFNTSVADLIDNSISAKATNIHVLIDENRDKKRIFRLLDNGKGMTSDALEEGMRLGSESDGYEPEDLGKFGFGMKTASLSQCTKMMVVTRNRISNKLSAFQWDLEHVKSRNDWSLQKFKPEEIKTLLSREIKTFKENFDGFNRKGILETAGTLILWENIRNSEDHLNNMVDKLKAHIGITFQRFIEGKIVKGVSIYINGLKILPIDPFCIKLKQTHFNGVKYYDPIGGNKDPKNKIAITSWVIPTKPEPGKNPEISFASNEEYKNSMGPKSWNESQGFYIYRNNRLIKYGGWNGVRQTETHIVTSRIAIDLGTVHDELFRVTVDKAKIIFPATFKDFLHKIIIPWNIKAHARSGSAKHRIHNSIRKNEGKITEFTREQLTEHQIGLTQSSGKKVIVKNPSGSFTKENILPNKFLSDSLFESRKLGKENYFWESDVDPVSRKLIIILNEDHPFFKFVYSPEKEKHSSYIDLFCLTMGFVELRCGTSSNFTLMQEIKKYASDFLRDYITSKIA